MSAEKDPAPWPMNTNSAVLVAMLMIVAIGVLIYITAMVL